MVLLWRCLWCAYVCMSMHVYEQVSMSMHAEARVNLEWQLQSPLFFETMSSLVWNVPIWLTDCLEDLPGSTSLGIGVRAVMCTSIRAGWRSSSGPHAYRATALRPLENFANAIKKGANIFIILTSMENYHTGEGGTAKSSTLNRISDTTAVKFPKIQRLGKALNKQRELHRNPDH